MKVKQDPVSKLWCREDGAVLMPPTSRYPYFRWTFGAKHYDGYLIVQYKGKQYQVHRIICCAFHGLPPADKPFCDHKNRIKSSNFASNLHWVDNKENQANADSVDRSVAKYGVRNCDDKKAYDAARYAKKRAQGLVKRKDSTGKWGRFARVRP